MKKVFLSLCLSVAAFASLNAQNLDSKIAQNAQNLKTDSINSKHIRILPINNAKFLAGGRFDFLVECFYCQTNSIKASINGVDAAKFFDKRASVSVDNGVVSYRINNVTFPRSGTFKVQASGKLIESKNTDSKLTESKAEISQNIAYKVVDFSQDNPKIKAKNVILFIGDGMSLQAKQMARILSKGITQGKYNGLLEMERLDNMALVTTSGYDALTTDSANSASAYSTGHKSVVNAMGVYENHTKNPFDDPRVETMTELLKRTRGMSVGLVTTANINDATPAAFATHTRNRDMKNEIAFDYLRTRPDIIMGGGLANFLYDEKGGVRDDGADLTMTFRDSGYKIAFNRKDLQNIMKDFRTNLKRDSKDSTTKILGLYNMDNMNVYLDREVLRHPDVLKNFDNEPNLMEMTKAALEILSQNENGFFLLVEGASIDKQLHKMDWQRAAYDAIELDKAVKIGRDFADKRGDTLIIVVADHAHGASITGTYHELDGKSGREAVRTYKDSIFPTFVDNDKDGFPDNPDAEITLAVQFANHPDYIANYHLKEKPTSPTIKDSNGRYIANEKVQGEHYFGNIPYKEDQEVHAADDVVLMAHGVGSNYFKGIMDNTEVFFGIAKALNLNAKDSKF
ncbi:alkaline phosphatase [Helicobacter saguini]|uniref:Alkaline phosphatase n=1 Tax=Helicobacter saguini TaxID=1548018 RepID=A0A347VRL7_9HELI|nr:alkaline phosphatase [Helicobacter saguini]MWV62855.1 alkaline phosphatase [Helicobacter saguini]MWV66474.1 alkaline phosphatase [Helicobacter saguini]MWV68824.1 alkaline phosphatase [Helicobacter saguini]MWV71621.1 alkaline phosphatase [Helicobacter saguini]TLD94426.1 alkaline phosphatase [Helicobacter saguini]